jgi:putative transposase
VQVRYHPEDLSRVYATVNGKTYVEAPYADLRRPRISLAEQRAICRWLRARGERHLTEALIFKAIEAQAAIVQKARAATRRRPDDKPRPASRTPGRSEPEPELDYSKPIEPYPGEIW